ncbi:dTDP-glucose 4,6-dehydratase [Candidatus Parcubacteria bacterium]|nr:dTDP-glucose 4,6-dehydratase [Candidatus Parcubacteria bacterium]
MMKLLITGGAGFIGSNFIHYILGKYPDYKIVNLDKLTYCGNLDNLKEVENNPNYKFIKGDICDKEKVTEIFENEKPDFIIHFAAETHVDRSILDPYAFIKTNVLGTHILLETAKKFGIERFLHISTDETYGSIENGKFKEEDILMPNSPYSASKASSDLLARSYFKTFSLPIIITRSSNNYGPYEYPEKVIPLFISNILEGKKVPLYGTGKNIRDWIFVLDNCEGIDTVLHNGEIGEIYNIGGGNEKTNLELTKIILNELGKDESQIEYVEDRLGHDFRYALDIEKAKKIGWEPKHSFEEAMKKTIAWYLENKDWWRKLKQEEFGKYYEKQYGER